MINETFDGVITAVSAGTKNIKNEEGTKEVRAICKFKIETSAIDYDSITEFDTGISAILQNIQPMPFKAVDFGDKSIYGMGVDLYGVDEETKFTSETPDATYVNVNIRNLKVKNDNEIPVYTFSLEMPIETSTKFLFNNMKKDVMFKFFKANV